MVGGQNNAPENSAKGKERGSEKPADKKDSTLAKDTKGKKDDKPQEGLCWLFKQRSSTSFARLG